MSEEGGEEGGRWGIQAGRHGQVEGLPVSHAVSSHSSERQACHVLHPCCMSRHRRKFAVVPCMRDMDERYMDRRRSFQPKISSVPCLPALLLLFLSFQVLLLLLFFFFLLLSSFSLLSLFTFLCFMLEECMSL